MAPSNIIPSAYLEIVQDACLPGVWSKGVALSRGPHVILDSQKPDELQLRVSSSETPVHRKVTLWPQDDDWFCDCQAKTDVCAHVVAALLTLKSAQTNDQANGQAHAQADIQAPIQAHLKTNASAHSAQIQYRFTRKEDRLHFERWLVSGGGSTTSPPSTQILPDSLVSWIGGVQSGRIQGPLIAATQLDYRIDSILGDQKRGELEAATLIRLIPALAECSHIYFEGQPITPAAKPYRLEAELVEEAAGLRLRMIRDPSVTEGFKNGAVLCGNILYAVERPSLTPQENALLAGDGRVFTGADQVNLLSNIVPGLEKKIKTNVRVKNLPKIVKTTPKIVLHLEPSDTGEWISFLPQIVYPEPVSPQVGEKVIAMPDPQEEQRLTRKLQSELQLKPGQQVSLRLSEAIDRYQIGSGFLQELGWETRLPSDWLERYSRTIQQLINSKAYPANSSQSATSPPLSLYRAPELLELYGETQTAFSETLKNLKERLAHKDQIPEATLPPDLPSTVILRPYQQQGVSWLSYLRTLGMGALLADDMGLGKTLQTLCTIQGRTLIVAPTSVIPNWQSQIQQFRPGIKLTSYHGPERKLDPQADVTLTSYAILRLDHKILCTQSWDTAIIDEAQNIKNPASQVAQATHALNAQFKIALSGTPVENRLGDLWSIFHFLNPGLLESESYFNDHFVTPLLQGDAAARSRLQRRIKPFILRRLKKDVAPELPPKTETVLYCELSQEERDTYDALLASTRKEILAKLEDPSPAEFQGNGPRKGTIFSALELLLRLRQACCHTQLLPSASSAGNNASTPPSSKVALLLESLERSLSGGHRALVFSQWTSFLDLIEPHLKSLGIRYSRLDGSTRNRAEVMNEFQSPTGPSVLLISLKAGGVGLNLTAADHLYLMDPWWNPAVEEQATDRAHRIGQTQPVFIHRLIAHNTVEERILLLQKSKLQLMESILENASAASSLTKEDLLMLLG